MNSFVIITGYSRGLGRQLAEAYAKKCGDELGMIGISRSEHADLNSRLNASCRWFRSLRADLSDKNILAGITDSIEKLTTQYEREFSSAERVLLINNAAILGPTAKLTAVASDENLFHLAGETLTTNVTAPVLLSGWFAERFADTASSEKYIINISSGASIGPINGAALYSMSKAALNMLSLSIASEEKNHNWPVKAFSIAPGMVETNMQEIIRSQTEENFPAVEYFRNAKHEGRVRNAAEVAEIIANLDLQTLDNGGYYHLRDFS